MWKTANSLFLFTSLFQRFKYDHHFPLNLKEKTNNVNTSYKSFEVLWNAGRC